MVGVGQDQRPRRRVALINWWVNSTEAAQIDKAERGIPANSEIKAAIEPKLTHAQQTVSKFIAEIKPELATTPIARRPAAARWSR